MEESEQASDSKELPPQQLFERLSYLSGYTWDTSLQPFHSSYDNWHVFGIQHIRGDKSVPTAGSVSTAGAPSESSRRSSPKLGSRPTARHFNTSSEALTDIVSAKTEDRSFIPVIARVSSHLLRLEREYQLGKTFIQTSDPDCHHTVRLLGLARLPARQSDPGPLAVEIFESPGRDYLRDLTDLGPAWYFSKQQSLQGTGSVKHNYSQESRNQIALTTFLDFAIGASECLELLHHGLKVVHGELRADAFHFDRDTGVVKLVNFGAGPRSFEHSGGLTSSGWSTLSRQKGIKNRLMFIAPEQTGRMSAEPDYRTDIYSLGILFWTMLAGEPVFDGSTAMDIMQSVLGKRIQPISSIRFDVPDVLSAIIQCMTQKQIDDRYHSSSGVRHDLVELKRILGEGDGDALINFQIGSKDVSSSFVLPTALIGRSQERRKIVQAMERIATKQQEVINRAGGSRMHSMNSANGSTISDRNDNFEAATRSSEVSSQDAKLEDTPPPIDQGPSVAPAEQRPSINAAQRSDATTIVEKPPLETMDSKDSVATAFTVDSHSSATTNSFRTRPLSGPSPRNPTKHRYSHRRRCEVVTVYGHAGLGKSSLIQATQSDIRKLGYFASAKFDPARKVPFETMLRTMSSLFRQIFSESDINTPYHNHIRANVRSIWPSLCGMLDLPENLVSTDGHGCSKLRTTQPVNKTLYVEGANSTASSLSPSANTSSHSGCQSMLDFLRGGSSAYSSKFLSIFLDVIRILATSKMICLCFDDLQFADEESVDLICNIISRRLGLVMIDSVWEYNLDSVFAEFETEAYGDQLNTSFILNRLRDLPPTSRAILAWGSLLGNTFSFSLVQKLLSGILDHVDDNPNQDTTNTTKGPLVTSSRLTETAVEGLQVALQAYILVPTIEEDSFRFEFPKPFKDNVGLTKK
ncbi:MAG: hypothetical protein Q9168_006327 [Polycauliona sp. 1 TL-2023]